MGSVTAGFIGSKLSPECKAHTISVLPVRPVIILAKNTGAVQRLPNCTAAQ